MHCDISHSHHVFFKSGTLFKIRLIPHAIISFSPCRYPIFSASFLSTLLFLLFPMTDFFAPSYGRQARAQPPKHIFDLPYLNNPFCQFRLAGSLIIMSIYCTSTCGKGNFDSSRFHFRCQHVCSSVKNYGIGAKVLYYT